MDCKTLPGFSWATLKRRMKRAKTFGFVLGMMICTMILKPQEEMVELDSIEGDLNEIFTTTLEGGEKNELLKERAVETAKEFYELGIF